MIINFKIARASAHLNNDLQISLPEDIQGKACLSAGMIGQAYYCQGNHGLRCYHNVMNAMESIALMRIHACNSRALAQ